MTSNELKSKVQQEALNTWIDKGCSGVVVMSMGTGKGKLFIDAIKTLRPQHVLIISPRNHLKEVTLPTELAKWGKHMHQVFINTYMYQVDDDISYNPLVTIENVQTCYKWSLKLLSKFDLVVVDEIHRCISPEFQSLICNALDLNKKILGLTGTPVKEDSFKAEFYKNKLPIVFEYYDSAKDGLINKTKHYIFRYELSDSFKITAGSAKKNWKTSELKQYTYLSERYEKAKLAMITLGADDYFNTSILWMGKKTKVLNPDNHNALEEEDYITVEFCKEQIDAGRNFFNSIRYRKEFLWNLESSAYHARVFAHRIKSNSKNKLLYFSALTKQSEKLSKYSIHSNKDTANNTKLLEQFNSGEIRELASCDMLTLGLNLIGANWIIMESFNGSESNNLQKVARGARLDVNEICNVIWIVPKGTQSETWLQSAISSIDKEDIVEIESLNLINV